MPCSKVQIFSWSLNEIFACCSDLLKMGRNFVFGCVLVLVFFLFSTQKQVPQIVEADSFPLCLKNTSVIFFLLFTTNF